jgi:hypothetical protein
MYAEGIGQAGPDTPHRSAKITDQSDKINPYELSPCGLEIGSANKE